MYKPIEGSTGQLTDIPDIIGRATTLLTSFIVGFSVVMMIYAGLLLRPLLVMKQKTVEPDERYNMQFLA
ncbi:hypothetical protein IPJ72_05935 [Candidatus Peregrinibacteria bacterium]|nr:MAG: hypothetical protein IPJ72_05935 [Candidatus Peregrinibacteria bacterium]